jgi:hypothetical protein
VNESMQLSSLQEGSIRRAVQQFFKRSSGTGQRRGRTEDHSCVAVQAKGQQPVAVKSHAMYWGSDTISVIQEFKSPDL